MMWTWVDGHLIAVVLAAPAVSLLAVAWVNARLRGGAR